MDVRLVQAYIAWLNQKGEGTFRFCCVMALLLLRVMELKAARAGLRMSPAVLKQELDDLSEIAMVYDARTAQIQISARSSVQQRLWDLFQLSDVENRLTGHAPTSHPIHNT